MLSDAPSTQIITEIPARLTSYAKDDLNKDCSGSGQFPEGGTAAWCAVVGGMLVQFCGFGYSTSFGVYQEFYTLNYLSNESTSSISWIGSINAFMLSAVGPVAGMLYDRGYFYHLLIGGSLLQSFSLFMLSLAKPGEYYQIFLAQGIGLGFAQGLVYVPTIAVVSHYFHRRRTLAMSLVASGTSLGSVIHPIMLNYLFNRGVGFTNGVRVSAAFISALLLLSCLIIRTRSKLPERAANYLSVGKGIIQDVPFCLMGVGFFLCQTGLYFPFFYFQLDSVLHGNSETFSFYSLVLLDGGCLIGRLSAGFIAPRVGVARIIIITAAVCAVFMLGMIGLGNIPSFVVIGTVYGYFAGVYFAMLSPLMSLLTSDSSELGVRMGIGFIIGGSGALIGGPVSGALLTSQYEWWKPALFSGFITLLGCFSLVLMEVARRQRQRAGENQMVEQKP